MLENKKRHNTCLLGVTGDIALKMHLYIHILKYLSMDLQSLWHRKYLDSGVFMYMCTTRKMQSAQDIYEELAMMLSSSWRVRCFGAQTHPHLIRKK